MTTLQALLDVRAAVAQAPGLITGAYVTTSGVCALGAAAFGPNARLPRPRRVGDADYGHPEAYERLTLLANALEARGTSDPDWIPAVNDRFVGSPEARRAYMLAYLDNRIAYHREHQGEPSPVEPMPTPEVTLA